MNNTDQDFSQKDYTLIAFLIPLVGIIMAGYRLWHNKNAHRAKNLLCWSLGGVVLNVIMYLIFK